MRNFTIAIAKPPGKAVSALEPALSVKSFGSGRFAFHPYSISIGVIIAVADFQITPYSKSPGTCRAFFNDTENPTVGIWFWGAKAGGTLRAGSDADEVGFFSIDNLPDRMAFPTDLLVCQKLERCLDSDDFSQMHRLAHGVSYQRRF
jgi:hypothetical protein